MTERVLGPGATGAGKGEKQTDPPEGTVDESPKDKPAKGEKK